MLSSKSEAFRHRLTDTEMYAGKSELTAPEDVRPRSRTGRLLPCGLVDPQAAILL